jgi:hypothetical protein
MKKHGSLIKLIALFILATFYFASIPTVHSSGKEKQVVGWVEVVTLLPENLQVKAKLDTGARNSSLNATNIVEFKRQGETFVRFELTNWKGRVETKEAQVIRVAKIKQHNSEPEQRPVVRIGLCLGNISKQVEVNLVNRSNFNYPMLIGRSFLKGDFVIDPARTYTVPANCRKFVRDE